MLFSSTCNLVVFQSGTHDADMPCQEEFGFTGIAFDPLSVVRDLRNNGCDIPFGTREDSDGYEIEIVTAVADLG